jgi:mannitol 2-dehydrogenase
MPEIRSPPRGVGGRRCSRTPTTESDVGPVADQTSPIPLREATLGQIAARGIPVPCYRRSALRPRVLHLGVGGFHRSHLALYLHELAEAGGDWGIRGIGMLPADRRMQSVLAPQDNLYSLMERASDDTRTQVIGSIVDLVVADEDRAALAAQFADPGIEIFSLTITEAGYAIDAANATIEAIVDGLAARRARAGAALTIMSCDNLPGNGTIARAAIVSVCEQRDPALARWVEQMCTFPNSMVDRITPQTSDDDRAWLRTTHGVDDGWPVVAEPFRQWVIEDRFAAGRPPLEDVGVLLTEDVRAWELYKLRMLNATHTCMAYLASLAGIVFVDQAMATAPLRRYLERLLREEVIPTLEEIPGHPREAYAAMVLSRFSSTGVRDQISRLCMDGTAKFPTFLIPTVERRLEQGQRVDCAALALASWARYLAMTPAAERAADARAEHSALYARRALDHPAAFLELAEVFPPALRDSDRLRDAFDEASRKLAEFGPIGAAELVAGAESAR